MGTLSFALAIWAATGSPVTPSYQGTGSVTRVTYENKAASTEVVLRDLSKKTGLRLEASPQTNREILTIRVVDVPVKDLLARIAWAVGGSWKQEKAARRLVQTPSDVLAERKRERDVLVARYRRLLATKRARLKKTPEFTRAVADRLLLQHAHLAKDPNVWGINWPLDDQAPVGRALDRLLVQFSPEELADLSEGIKVVYATKPTPSQRRFRFRTAPIVSQFVKEQAVWLDRLARVTGMDPKVEVIQFQLNSHFRPNGQEKKVKRVLLSIIPNGFENGISFGLSFLDKTGDSVAKLPWSDSLEGGRDSRFLANDVKVQILPEYGEFYRTTRASRVPPTVPSTMRERFLHPEIYEPLGYLTGSSLINLAKAKRSNLVASVGESSWEAFDRDAKNPVSSSSILRKLADWNEIQDDHGWITLRPCQAMSNQEARVDRTALGGYLRRFASPEPLSITERIQWNARIGNPQTGLTLQLSQYLDSVGIIFPDPIPLLGSLTPTQQRQARQGGLSFGALSPSQIEAIKRILYGPIINLTFDPVLARKAGIMPEFIFDRVLWEPTEAIPNGITPSGKLTITDVRNDAVFLDPKLPGNEYHTAKEGHTAKQLAQMKVQEAQPFMKDFPKENRSRMRLGSKRILTMTLKFTPLVSVLLPIEEINFTSKDYVPYSSLPASFLRAVDKAVVEKPWIPRDRSGKPFPPSIKRG